MLVQYYDNRLIVVGKLWCGHEGSCVYTVQRADAKSLYDQFDDPDFVHQWCTKHAGDFESVKDYQLEVFEKTKPFDNEDSWLLVN